MKFLPFIQTIFLLWLSLDFTSAQYSKRYGHRSRSSEHYKPGKITFNLQPKAKGYTIEHHNHSTNSHDWSLMQNQDSVATFYGCPSLDFSIPVMIGTQGPFNLIIDTGSSTLAVASQACGSACSGVTPLLNTSQAGISILGGTVSSRYADGSSWSGRVLSAAVSTGDSLAVATVIATVDSQTNDFISRGSCLSASSEPLINYHQGIIGFAYPSLAVGNTDSWFFRYVEDTNIPNEFYIQLCMTSGNLWVGGFDSNYASGAFQYVAIARSIHYSVYLQDVQVNGVSAGNTNLLMSCGDGTNYCAVVDSGTTNIVFPSAIYNTIVSRITSNANFISAFNGYDIFGISGRSNCAPVTSSRSASTLNSQLPPLQFVFSQSSSPSNGPITLTLNPVNSYLVTYYLANGDAYYCAGIQNGGSVDFQGTLMGIAFMNQFTTHHDIANNRLGFAPTARCGTVAPPLTNYVWSTGAWGACSAPCGGGTQFRNVSCADTSGTPKPALLCSGSVAAPPSTQFCSNVACTSSVTATTINVVTASPTTGTAGTSTISIAWMITGETPINVQLVMRQGTGYPRYLARSVPGSSYSWKIPYDATAGTWQIGAYDQNSTNIVYGTSVTITACGSCTQPTCGITDNFCNNHGGCSDSTGSPQCTCIGGWNGTRCTTAPTTCVLQCLNGGTPTPSNCSCSCLSGFAGAMCDLRVATYDATIDVPVSLFTDTSSSSGARFNFINDIEYATGAVGAVAIVNVSAQSSSQTLVTFSITSRSNNSILSSYTTQLNALLGLLQPGVPSNLGSGLVLVGSEGFETRSLPDEPGQDDDSGDSWVKKNTAAFAVIIVVVVLFALFVLYCLCRQCVSSSHSKVQKNLEMQSGYTQAQFVQPQYAQPYTHNNNNIRQQRYP